MREGRLELDEHGRVLDAAPPVDLDSAPSPDVLAGGTDGLAPLRRWASHHKAAAALLGTVTLALVAAGAASVVAPGPGPQVTLDGPGAAVATPWPALTAFYRVSTDVPLRAGELVGPLVAASKVLIRGSDLLEVDAVPDCSDPASLDPAGGTTYTARLETREGPVVVALPEDVLDWGQALRRACWLQRAADGLSVRAVDLRPDPQGRWIGLDLVLANATGRPVQATSRELVDRVRPGARTVVVEDGGDERLLVRMPLGLCTAGPAGPRTTVPWRVSLAVGPPGSRPLAEVAVDVSRDQRVAIAAQVQSRCAPTAGGA